MYAKPDLLIRYSEEFRLKQAEESEVIKINHQIVQNRMELTRLKNTLRSGNQTDQEIEEANAKMVEIKEQDKRLKERRATFKRVDNQNLI